MVDERLGSEKVVIQSPTSFTGSAKRIWKLTRLANVEWHPAAYWTIKVLLVTLAVVLVAIAWVLCAIWLVLFGILMVPWRLIRRGGRKRKMEELRHREMMAASQREPV